MNKKRELFSKGLAILARVAALMISFVAVTAFTADEKPELTASSEGQIRSVTAPASTDPRPKSTDPIIWDNGGTVPAGNLLSSQNDAVYPFVSQTADDFMFPTDMLVTDVHWWGGFWNGPPDEVDPCDFHIYIYADDGTGTMPTGAGMPDPAPTALASYFFPGLTGYPLDPNGFYEYDVDLSPGFSAAAGVKYWIAIQADFPYPPQWGWTFHSVVQLHQAMQGFPFIPVPFWTDPYPPDGVDMAFYLTGVPSGPPWPNHKMHFPQLPDLIGWDVLSTAPIICADDWQCSQTGPVEDIHFWGSWKNLDGMPGTDDYPPGGEMPQFAVFILRNIPADIDTPWSRPGEVLWEWWGEILGTPFDPPTLESWYNPVIDSTICNDHIPYWRYDFVDIPEPFIQYKDSIYWLAVANVNVNPPYEWGWKNSRDHFEDDAVWSDDPYQGPWFEMYEPPRCNWFDVLFDATGTPEDWGSSNYYGQGWYFYPEFGWWNMWFYDNPFTYDHPKEVFLDFYVEPVGPQAYAEFAINWSTDIWYFEGEPGRPPLPADVAGMPEEIFIGRQEFPVVPGWNHIEWFWQYNPEWISLDFRAIDVIINGFIYHECVGTSMDLAFVITGEPPPVICGDVNNDGIVNVGDIVYLVTYLYRAGPAPIPQSCVGDVNNDDIVNVGDIVYLVT
ncbi:MAG: dockerin type I repeat-containing protein, partial [Candidatus Zixiibacteriota bacterium]